MTDGLIAQDKMTDRTTDKTDRRCNQHHRNRTDRQMVRSTPQRNDSETKRPSQDEIQGVAREYPGPVKVPMSRVRNEEMLGRAITGQCPEDSRDAGPFTPKHEKTKDSLMTGSLVEWIP